MKIARTVRWGAVGKVPRKNCGNSLAAYPTSWTATAISTIPRTVRTPVCSADSSSGTAMSVFDTADRAMDVQEQEGGSSGLQLLR